MTGFAESDGLAAAFAAGKMQRTIHTGYEMGILNPGEIDVTLTPAEGDSLTILTFIDVADGEQHLYVLNEEYRQQLIKVLTGGVIVGMPGRNGTG